MTTYSKYILLVALVLLVAVSAVLWKDDPEPTITFTRPDAAVPEIKSQSDVAAARNQQRLEQENVQNPSDTTVNIDGIVPLTEPILAPEKSTEARPELIPFDNMQPTEKVLSDAQLAKQIKLAQARLAEIEALNERKQNQVQELLSQEQSAEKSLLEAELAYYIDGWRRAWSRGDVSTYFEFYSQQFKPSGDRTLEQWKAQRAKRLNPKSPVELSLENVQVEFDPESQRSSVRFKQIYKSATLKDISEKRLILANEQGRWKIIAETSQASVPVKTQAKTQTKIQVNTLVSE